MSFKTKTGNVFVDKVDVLEDLIVDSVSQSKSKSRYRQATMASNTSDQSETFKKQLMLEKMSKKQHETDSLMKQNIKKQLHKKQETQERTFSNLMTELDRSSHFLNNEVEKLLNLHDETQRNKTRKQFEDWNTQIHGAIQINISKKLSKMDSKTLNQRRCDAYAQFLDVTNRKPAIFRDIIIESEYDPLEPNRRCITARVGKLKDPTLIDQQKAEEEANMLGSGDDSAGPNDTGTMSSGTGGPNNKSNGFNSRQLCKDTLSVELWAAGQIEATPHGSFAKLMTDHGSKPNPTLDSHIVFDHFQFPRGPKGREVLESEMPRGKRVDPSVGKSACPWDNTGGDPSTRNTTTFSTSYTTEALTRSQSNPQISAKQTLNQSVNQRGGSRGSTRTGGLNS